MKLQGRTVIVTGADSGIGQAIAILFAAEGANLCIGYHTDADGAAETRRQVEAAGRRAVVVQGDVGRPDDVRALFAAAADLGVIDVLINNAGKGMGGTPVDELEDDMLELVLRTNLMGPLFCCREFIRLRKAQDGGGRIVTISSVAQHLPTPGSAPYGMSKAGVGSLTRSLAVELAPHRINVNNIAPGLIATPMTADRLDDPDKKQKSMDRIPWRREGHADEIARLALFLASDDGDYVTGQTWTMDGGLTMNWGGA